MRKHKGVRDVPSRPAKQTLTLITQKCAAYYADGLDENAKRALIQDIWRYANFALMRLKRKAGKGRKRTTDKRIRKIESVQQGGSDGRA